MHQLPVRRFALLAPTVLVTALTAAEPAVTPVAEVRMADGKDLLAHWDGTPIGRTWADPALDPLRAKWQEARAKLMEKEGIDPLAVVEALRDLRLVIDPGSAPEKPVLRAQAGMGEHAARLFDDAKDGGNATEIEVPGADGALANDPTEKVQAILARYGQHLVLTLNAPSEKPETLAAAPADLLGRVDLARAVALFEPVLLANVEGPALEQVKSTFADLHKEVEAQGLGEASYRLDLTAQGIVELIDVAVAHPAPNGTMPVDRAVLTKLPGNTLMAAAAGIDYGPVWAKQRTKLLAQWAPLLGVDPADPDATEKAIDGKLAAEGLPFTVTQLAAGLKGTFALALTPGMPVPGLTVVLPRTQVIDQAIVWVGTKAGFQAPAVGSSVLVPLPNPMMPPLSLVCTADGWLISSDAILADSWLGGTSGGWDQTPAMQTVLAKAPADASLIGASDTPAVIRLLQTYATMAMGFAKDLDQPTKTAIQQGLVKLAQQASTGYLYAGPVADGTHQMMEVRSLTGMLPLPAVIGASAIPFLVARQQEEMMPMGMDDDEVIPPTSTGPAPQTVLKELIYPAQVRFQASALIDQNGDGAGEYGYLSELAGTRETTAGQPADPLLEGFQGGDTLGDWRYTIYLPDGRRGAQGEPDGIGPRTASKKAAAWQQSWFLAYAWPATEDGGTMYCLLPNGAVYEAPYEGSTPTWNAVFTGGTPWGTPTWIPASEPSEDVAPEAEPEQMGSDTPVSGMEQDPAQLPPADDPALPGAGDAARPADQAPTPPAPNDVP